MTYTIVETTPILGGNGDHKKRVQVRLNRIVPEEVVRAISQKLHVEDSARDFIAYLLPKMNPGEGAWAIAEFSPTFRVRIIGMTIEMRQKVLDRSRSLSGDLVGRWIDDSTLYALIKSNNEFRLVMFYHDGSSHAIELIERKSQQARRFDEKETSSSGDHYVIVGSGDLEVRDKSGLVTTALKVE